jgi:hypothetical protein
MTVELLDRCACCGSDGRELVLHHWIENGETKENNICKSCNSILWTREGSHKLPSWTTQCQYVEWYKSNQLMPNRVSDKLNPYDWREYKEKDYDEIGEMLRCQKCGYEWMSRIVGSPNQCPNCKRHDWNRVK